MPGIITRQRSIDVVFLAVLSAYIIAGAPLVPFHGDEATLLHMSRDYGYQVLDGDWQRVRFDDRWTHGDDQMLRLQNGTISKYVFGLAWHAAGLGPADLNREWDFRWDWQKNLARGNLPKPEVLRAARRASALMLSLATIALFVLGKQVGGRPVAYLACAYFASNPAVLLNGRRAIMESALLLFSLLTVLAGIRYLRRPGFASAMVMGALAGLALSAKHTNILAVLAVGGGCLAFPLVNRAWFRKSPGVLGHALIAASSSIAVFLALNPIWWGMNPISMGKAVLRERQSLLTSFTTYYGGYPDLASRAAGAFRQVFVVEPQYFELARFGPPIAPEIAAYERSWLRGISVGGSVPGGLIVVALSTIGLGAFLTRRAASFERKFLVALWAMGTGGVVLVLTPLEWQRYYIPAYPVVGLLAATGLAHVASRAKNSAWLLGRRARSPLAES